MIESIMAILIISVMYVAALNTVGASRVSEALIANQRKGHQLAQQLLSEIVMLPYVDPVFDSGALGPSSAEAATGDRSLFNDVDDYHLWTEGPPQNKNGSVMSDLSEWKRAVVVAWVDPSNIEQTRSGETNLKRITVTVSLRGKTVATLQAIRAKVD